MNLYAVLNYYDESPTWLAGCVASLQTIGVDHLVAVDGRYPHFEPGAPVASNLEQHDAILSTAACGGMGVTTYRPTVPMMETTKRELCHRLVETIAVPMRDWFFVIDADEYVSAGSRHVVRELEAMDSGIHAAACRVSSTVDPHAEPGPDNDVRSSTEDIYQKIPIDPTYTALQSRFWRVMHDMRVGPRHFDYLGSDDAGTRFHLRADIGSGGLPPEWTATEIGRVDCSIMHRKNHRLRHRRDAKARYYEMREQIGLERSPVAT